MKQKINNKRLMVVLLALITIGFGSSSQAALVTDAADIPNAAVIDFSEFAGGWLYGAGPVQIGNPVSRDIEWSSSTSNSVIGDGAYGLLNNGNWTSARVGFTGLNAASGHMTYQFNDAPVAAVGGFMNYATGNGTPVIEVLDQNGAVLESYDVLAMAPISTPNGTDEGAFRGIVRPQADIYALRITNAFDVLDDLTFTSTVVSRPPIPPSIPVPALSTWALLLLAGLMGVAAFTRRRA